MADRNDLVKFFREADVDESGNLTIAELTAILRKYGYRGTDNEIQEFFTSADTSGDERVSLDEYLKAMEAAPVHVHMSAQLRCIFAEFDRDDNGEITPQEFRTALQEMGSPLSETVISSILSQLDKDNSNTINVEEFVTAFIKYTARHQ